MKNFFLALSGVLFTLITLLHLVRFFAKWPVTIGSFTVPAQASLWAALVSFLLSLGCLLAWSRKS